MSELELLLTRLLASYEADEPHVNLPGLNVGDEASQFYPEFTPEQVGEWLDAPHEGDCIELPAPCRRCRMESWAHKARWMAARLYPC